MSKDSYTQEQNEEFTRRWDDTKTHVARGPCEGVVDTDGLKCVSVAMERMEGKYLYSRAGYMRNYLWSDGSSSGTIRDGHQLDFNAIATVDALRRDIHICLKRDHAGMSVDEMISALEFAS